MRRTVTLAAVMVMSASAAPASAALLREPGWAKPLIAQLFPLVRPYVRAVVPPAPALPPSTLRGFTCYIDSIGSAITAGAVSPCDRPAITLPIRLP